MVCAAGRLQAQAQARRTRRGTAACCGGVSNAGEGKKIPMLQGNPTRQDCHAVMGWDGKCKGWEVPSGVNAVQ